MPAFGVYAAWVTLPDGTRRAAVTNLGVRPTVEEAGALWVESYLLDFSGDLYGQELTVTPVSYTQLMMNAPMASLVAVMPVLRGLEWAMALPA